MATNYLRIESEDGKIVLSCLFDHKTNLVKDCIMLYFEGAEFENCWDSKPYIYSLFRAISGGDKLQETKKQQLKDFCKQNNFNYKEVKKDLIDLYENAKKFGLWETENKS